MRRINFDITAFARRAAAECPRCRGQRGDGLYCPSCAVLVAREEAARLEAERRRAEREQAEAARVEAQAREDFFLQLCPPLYRGATLDGLPTAIRAGIQRWAWRGPLYLWGQVGTGKTFSTWGLVRHWVANDLGGPPSFVRVGDLLDSIGRSRFADTDPVAPYASADLLVLDDLAAGSATEFERAALLRLVDSRVNSWLPTIITSNLAPGALAAAVDDRLASRLASGVVVRVDGPDRRIKKAGV